METQPATGEGAAGGPAQPERPRRGLPKPGELFGHYQIAGLLGEGGMGAVFEAEDVECGRRVALKVLGHTLDSPEARARFFREGRLAASINHPNSVYVFGTEEIAGIPVIAMELVAGGTLQDRVLADGALPATEAVDSVLQIIAGLEAAQQIGVLHRDVKPSNCFVDSDGTVKVGDFGLSISTMVRTEPSLTSTGSFLGTPVFSSPEQLRGDELTVRSDIYAVGVTLYYLLTGRKPFEGGNIVQLLATVLERRADSPARWRSGLPKGLCRAVLRCLEKSPDERFKNYAELREALLPYASMALTPATPGLRLLAGGIDAGLLGLAQNLLGWLILGAWTAMAAPDIYHHPLIPRAMGACLAALIAYYTVLEGVWGVSAGKAVCRLRVVGPQRQPPGPLRAALRAAVFLIVPMLPLLATWFINPDWLAVSNQDWRKAFLALTTPVLTALLFSSARRHNGFAGWHELASGTRVVLKAARLRRPILPPLPPAVPTTSQPLQIGPYHLLDRLVCSDGAELWRGFDPRLLRSVWIRQLPAGAAPTARPQRNVGRPGRLRWLSGRRSETEAWDAYEASEGQPFLSLAARPQSWGHVRFWLSDLAEELAAAALDGSSPETLSLNRVWITAEGRAKLLDFAAPVPAPASQPAAGGASVVATTPGQFLKQVALCALEGRVVNGGEAETRTVSVPVPWHAREWLKSLEWKAVPAGLAASLKPLLGRVAEVTRWRRLGLVAGCAALPLIIGVVILVGISFSARFAKANPELSVLRECLVNLAGLEQRARRGEAGTTAERDAFQVYIAGRFRPVVTNAAVWRSLGAVTTIPQPHHELADRIIASHPAPTAAEMAEARAVVERYLKKTPDQAAADTLRDLHPARLALIMVYGNTVLLVVAPCLIASLLCRGGAMLWVLGLTVVNRDGSRAGRWRVGWRNLLAWLPLLLAPLFVMCCKPVLGTNGAIFASGGMLAAFVLASLLAARVSLQDRLAGTCLVPR